MNCSIVYTPFLQFCFLDSLSTGLKAQHGTSGILRLLNFDIKLKPKYCTSHIYMLLLALNHCLSLPLARAMTLRKADRCQPSQKGSLWDINALIANQLCQKSTRILRPTPILLTPNNKKSQPHKYIIIPFPSLPTTFLLLSHTSTTTPTTTQISSTFPPLHSSPG